MVSTYLLVKLFKKAATERLNNDIIGDRDDGASTSREDAKVINKCRICLKDGRIPIFNDTEQETTDISRDITTFADIVICKDDDFPKCICEHCNNLLQAAILFRKTAKHSEHILKTTAINRQVKSKPATAKSTKKKSKEKPDLTLLNKYFSPVLSDDDISLSSDESKPVKAKKKPNKVQCKICLKIITKAYYKEHFSLHDFSLSPSKYVCDICGKSFRQRCSYRTHRFTHSSSFPYKCKICPYRGRHAGLLTTHMKTHSGDYRYMCTECPARFLTKSNLNRHTLKHKEPEFKCDMCKRAFHTKIIMERHFEVDHLGIKNHICNICGKAFGYRKALMRHELDVHKREKKMNGRTPSYIEAELNKNNVD